MTALDTFECDNCGEAFKAHPDANAAEREACSPHCDLATIEA